MNSVINQLLSSNDIDDEQISKISVLVRHLLSKTDNIFGGTLTKFVNNDVIDSGAATFLYYTFTSGSGLQTLGEEMNFLVPHKNSRLPSLVIRTVYILLQTFGTNKLLGILSDQRLPGLGNDLIKHLRLPLSILVMYSGSSVVQYFLGIRNHALRSPLVRYPFYLVVILDVLYVVLELYKRHQAPPPTPSPAVPHTPALTDLTCSVCTEQIPLGHVTSSPCGHVGCWECLNRAGAVKPACPICKGPIFPLLALRNITHY